MGDADITKLGGGAAPPGAAPPAPPGPQFSTGGKAIRIDFAEANRALAHLDEAYRALDDAWRHAQRFALIRNPGNEDPSHGFARNANSVGASLRDELLHCREQTKAQYETLKATLTQYQHNEEGNAANLNNQVKG